MAEEKLIPLREFLESKRKTVRIGTRFVEISGVERKEYFLFYDTYKVVLINLKTGISGNIVIVSSGNIATYSNGKYLYIDKSFVDTLFTGDSDYRGRFFVVKSPRKTRKKKKKKLNRFELMDLE